VEELMKQIVELTYWYHVVNKYGSISECVNAWLAAHPKAQLIGRVQIESDPTFFKRTLYKALFTVSTKAVVADDFDCFERDPERDRLWEEQERQWEAAWFRQPRKTWRRRLADWFAR
jgi:hypothetical protein